MKKLICCVMLIALSMVALAAPSLDNMLLSDGLAALKLLSSGEYERLVTTLPYDGVSPSASEWSNFADNFASLHSGVQQSFAVGYFNGRDWCIAVPTQSDPDESSETMVLLSEDGVTIYGYRYAFWGKISGEIDCAEEVVYN